MPTRSGKSAAIPTGSQMRFDRRGAHHCYLELHIEQGGSLERQAIPIGVVEGIVAIDRYR